MWTHAIIKVFNTILAIADWLYVLLVETVLVWKQQIWEQFEEGLVAGCMMVVACGAAMVSSSPKVPSPRWPWFLGNQEQHYLAMRGLHMIAAGAGVLWEGSQHGPSLYYSSWRVQSLSRGISGVTITKHWLPDAIEQSAATVCETKKKAQVVRHLMLQREICTGLVIT